MSNVATEIKEVKQVDNHPEDNVDFQSVMHHSFLISRKMGIHKHQLPNLLEPC